MAHFQIKAKGEYFKAKQRLARGVHHNKTENLVHSFALQRVILIITCNTSWINDAIDGQQKKRAESSCAFFYTALKVVQ
ncbi:hypothetical protein [Deefgea piscis]|uniref:hypothetical protein n=1 Tax=Deefgea piscis TaxID=2739061 RepID=UPI001C7F5DC9|nr:hypothetical protein [Deefgea piscis]QZA81491.1 hypothetical protein K4H25_02175 [Deefgea piscis]